MNDTPVMRRGLPGGAWSIVAPGRSARPQAPAGDFNAADAHCHFCPGNERDTEPEVFAVRDRGSAPDTPGWAVRVVPNKYPALQPHAGMYDAEASPHRQVAANGLHEVIVETPQHERRLADFHAAELGTVLAVYKLRVQAVSRHRHVRSVALFRNEGRAAGASQEHTHAQLVALPIVPGRLASEIAGAVAYFRRRHRCPSCHAVERESSTGSRLVARNGDFVAVTSFAPRFPYETWVMPTRHQHDFRRASARQIRSLGALLSAVLKALRAVVDPLPYNLVLQTSPVRTADVVRRAFHWRLEIVPRLTTASGFELGSGVFIVSVTPEHAAATLRAALPCSGQSAQSRSVIQTVSTAQSMSSAAMSPRISSR